MQAQNRNDPELHSNSESLGKIINSSFSLGEKSEISAWFKNDHKKVTLVLGPFN